MSENRNTPPTTLSPHLTCRQAAEAVEFYRKAFDANIVHVLTLPDGLVAHATLTIGEATVYVTEECPEQKRLGPQGLGGTPVTLHLQVSDCDTVFRRAVEAGCQVLMPLEDQFWGDRYGLVSDPYGHQWAVATTIRPMNTEELRSAMETAFAEPA
ncbi:MAG: VOC family protein [Capsulimonadales bacterium]|nr:VOC family protein [Capsulimonadales bacterium]